MQIKSKEGMGFMKKSIALFLSFIFILLFAAGCGNTEGQDASADSQEKLTVYASFYPMYDFASKIGGDKANVEVLVPAGVEPHDWEPSTTDITKLETADIFVYNGAGMEHWTADVLASLQNKDLLSVETSAGLTLLEGHHDHEGEEEGTHEEEEAHEEEESYDPHVWLDPMNAKAQMAAIKDAFIKADPENSAYYEANYETYATEFDALDNEFREGLSGYSNRDIIVAHEAFGYLCKAYDLNQIGIEGLSADSEPDPARMAEIIDFAKEKNITTIFFEELVSPKVAETIADAVGAKTAVLSPIEGPSDEQTANGDDYFTIMRQNLAALQTALDTQAGN